MHEAEPPETPGFWPYEFDEMRRAAADLEGLRYAAGALDSKPPGRRNRLVRVVKNLLARLLTWHTPPLRQFDASVTRSVQEIVSAVEHLSMNVLALDRLAINMAALEQRITQSEKSNAALAEALARLRNTAPSASGSREIVREMPAPEFSTDSRPDSVRTTYLIGLFGTGRHYLNDLMRKNLGERSKYFRDTIRLHPGPTPMIYSGHATIRYVSRGQVPPEVMRRIADAAKSGFADVIFICRHPLDSLLSNWVWWRTYLRENRRISGISEIYQSTDDLCNVLEANFLEFQAFAAGDPDFFAVAPGPPFLSFPEFVEETELHLQSATLSLRLEDFSTDPRQEFLKILEVMSVDVDWSRLSLAPPKSQPFGHLAVKEKLPRFREFMRSLDVDTRNRIERIGYSV
jgi:hypothetical protein